MGNIGPGKEPITLADGSTEMALPGVSETPIYSKSFSLRNVRLSCLSLLDASDGNTNIKVEVEQSYKRPTTEGEADDTYAVPETAPVTITLTGKTQKHITLSPLPLEFGRLKLTRLVGNDDSTELTAFLSKVEEI